MAQFLKKIYRLLKQLPHIYKYGGITNVNVSKIDYHGALYPESTLVLVTGGTSGIGLEIAKRCHEEGATVVVTGRNVEKLNSVNAAMNSSRFITLQWDVTDINSIPSKIQQIEERTGKHVSILVNNAGTYARTHFPNTTSEDWDEVYLTNLKGLYFLTQHMVKLWMNRQDEGIHKVLNIASQGGFVGANNAYRMTKWDIRGFTKHLGQTYSKYGIIANAIAPGIIKTNMQPEFMKQGDNVFTDLNPAHRIGLPIEIAELALFLTSPASNFIVGECICCDGGYNIK